MRHILFFLALAVCSFPAIAQETKVFGKDLQLPKPSNSLIPTVKIAEIVGWDTNETPVAAAGLQVQALARGLDNPRWIYVLPNNDVLVAESRRPPKEDISIKDWIVGKVMKHATGGGKSADRIILLRDADGDGTAEMKTSLLENLYSPFGMALVDGYLYVANANGIVRYPYESGQTKIQDKAEFVTDLPGGPRNHHWTKNILPSKDSTKLYAAVGSNSDHGENGIEEEKNRAAILEVDIESGKTRVFASGLRNPVGMGWNPVSGELWTSVNERDELGDELVPDFMTSVKDGGFYGWPYSYYGQNIDKRVEPQRPELVEKAIVPDYALGAHTASLGLAFYTKDLMPRFKNGALIGQHGSWNRSEYSGYKMIFVPFENGKPAGPPQDVLIGFLNDEGQARGRPAGVAVDQNGAILLADDAGNTIWRVTPASGAKR